MLKIIHLKQKRGIFSIRFILENKNDAIIMFDIFWTYMNSIFCGFRKDRQPAFTFDDVITNKDYTIKYDYNTNLITIKEHEKRNKVV